MNKMTDEELLSELAIRLNSLEAVAVRDEVATSIVRCSEIVKALTESRKGMFTEDDMINFAQSECANYDNEDFMRERLTQYLTERKGR